MSKNEFEAILTPASLNDLDSIYRYITINLQSDISARNLLDKIEERILQLELFPYSCEFVQDEALKSKGYRKLIIDNYIAFYKVNEIEEQVVIMRVLYGSQNYKGIL